MGEAFHNWFRLLRVPNLFTAPGDTLGGLFFTALLLGRVPQVSTILAISAASILAYAFGILTNDLRDLNEDRRVRPERPLPSGAISVWSAVLAAAVTCAGCLACSGYAFASGGIPLPWILLLPGAILLYNGLLKQTRYLGALAMGLCRGVNVWLGIACLHPPVSQLPVLLLPAVAVTLYITVVTVLADGENGLQIPGRSVFLPSFFFLAAWLLALPQLPYPQMLATGALPVSFLLLFLAVGMVFMNALGLYGHRVPPLVMQPAIGAFIRALLPWQMAWIVLHGSLTSWLTAVVLMAAFFLSRRLARRFPQS